MSRFITFSRVYPSYHPRKVEPTYFVEKIWNSVWRMNGSGIDYKYLCDLNPNLDVGILWNFWKSIDKTIEQEKQNTIRAGHRFKVDDWFSPRVWGNDINPKSGRSGPYHSKHIIIAPDIQVKKTWTFEIRDYRYWLNEKGIGSTSDKMLEIAINDGLTRDDFHSWFQYPKPFDGQIICWDNKLEY